MPPFSCSPFSQPRQHSSPFSKTSTPSSGHSVRSKATTTTKRKAATVNSPDTNSSAASGSNTSLTRKIKDIFLQKRGAVLKRIYAGLNSNSACSSESSIQNPGMFTPHGISDLKLTPDDITALINSPILSNGERSALKTYTQTSGTANDMNAIAITPEINPIVYAIAKDEDAEQPKYYYFIAYQFRLGGNWYTTNIYLKEEEARAAASDKAILRKKLCCVRL